MLSSTDIWKQLFGGPGLMDNVCNFIIRPPRSDYEMEDLGPEVFRVGDDGTDRFDRTDFELENMRGMMLQCSWFRPVPQKPGGSRAKLPCVVYCHANCGGRYDSLEALFLLEVGFTLLAVDFSGSGMSEGEYISLGFYERQDLAIIVEFLHSKQNEVDGVGLWGRSMGAVTAIMYASKDPHIRCIVCDSPFASLRLLIQDLVAQHGGRAGQLLPNAVLNAIVERIRRHIAKRAAFDIDDLDTLKYAASCEVPALLFHGRDDDFVSPLQSMRVRDCFKGTCLHELTEGGHNDERNEEMQAIISAFFRLYMIEKTRGARDELAQKAAAAATTATVLVGKPTGVSSSSGPSSPLAASGSGSVEQPVVRGEVVRSPAPVDTPQTEPAGAPLELGKGQSGPISVTPPLMKSAVLGTEEPAAPAHKTSTSATTRSSAESPCNEGKITHS